MSRFSHALTASSACVPLRHSLHRGRSLCDHRAGKEIRCDAKRMVTSGRPIDSVAAAKRLWLSESMIVRRFKFCATALSMWRLA
jgi:hypothetical protein